MMAKKRNLKNLGRRGLSLFLSLVMTLSLIQISVFAGSTAVPLPTVTVAQDGQLVTNEATGESSYVGIQKSITPLKGTDDQFTITLDVTTTASTEFIKVPAKADVVIVLDTSGSMCKNLNSGHSWGRSCATEGCALNDEVIAAN